MNPVRIDITAKQVKAIEVHRGDWEVKILGVMLGFVFMGTLVAGAIIVAA